MGLGIRVVYVRIENTSIATQHVKPYISMMVGLHALLTIIVATLALGL
jgi:hypothetical protein